MFKEFFSCEDIKSVGFKKRHAHKRVYTNILENYKWIKNKKKYFLGILGVKNICEAWKPHWLFTVLFDIK